MLMTSANGVWQTTGISLWTAFGYRRYHGYNGYDGYKCYNEYNGYNRYNGQTNNIKDKMMALGTIQS